MNEMEKQMEMSRFGPMLVKEDERQEIREALSKIKADEGKKIYNGQGLKTLFDYWHKYFPNQKQNMNCLSCRKMVHKFWGNIASELWVKHIVDKEQ